MSDPRPASTVVAVRDSEDGLEVLLGRRPVAHAFGGVWVFPGGSVDADDHDEELTGVRGDDRAWRAAALREVAEEVGIFLTDPSTSSDVVLDGRAVHEHVRRTGAAWQPERLGYMSNWVTPEGLPKRFDTRFYLAVVSGEVLGPISPELEQVEWMRPGHALARYDADEIDLILPTLAHLRMIEPFTSAAEVHDHVMSEPEVVAVQPRIVRRNGKTDIEIP